jgi:hypothetical protein
MARVSPAEAQAILEEFEREGLVYRDEDGRWHLREDAKTEYYRGEYWVSVSKPMGRVLWSTSNDILGW